MSKQPYHSLCKLHFFQYLFFELAYLEKHLDSKSLQSFSTYRVKDKYLVRSSIMIGLILERIH